jgi:DNA-binding NarL/FixJ family response regulator
MPDLSSSASGTLFVLSLWAAMNRCVDDMLLADGTGLELTRELIALNSKTRILISSDFDDVLDAAQMYLSPKTIETYRENIKSKLNLQNATELLQHAVR